MFTDCVCLQKAGCCQDKWYLKINISYYYYFQLYTENNKKGIIRMRFILEVLFSYIIIIIVIIMVIFNCYFSGELIALS